MANPLKSLKARVQKHLVSNPRLYREYWFLKSSARFFRRYFSNRDEWIEILEKPPSLVGFNTTGVCDANCCYCAYRFHKPDGVMAMDIFEKGVKEFSEMGGGRIGLSPLTGEPLLDPYFTERVELAAGYENITEITFDTNGISMKKEETREKLLRLSSIINIHMNISIPSFDKEMFERVYETKWDDAILYGIEHLLKANRELERPMRIILCFQPDRPDVLLEPNYRTHIRPYIDEERNVIVGELRDNWCGQIEQRHLPGDMTLKRQPVFMNLPCEVLLDRHVDILVSGDVRMCGCRYGKEGKHDDLVIGNIKDESLSKIWFGNRPRELCHKFLKGELPKPCRPCSMYLPY